MVCLVRRNGEALSLSTLLEADTPQLRQELFRTSPGYRICLHLIALRTPALLFTRSTTPTIFTSQWMFWIRLLSVTGHSHSLTMTLRFLSMATASPVISKWQLCVGQATRIVRTR